MKTLDVTRVIAHPRALVFAVVADIERYPEFVPGFVDAGIVNRTDTQLWVRQSVGVAGLTAAFTSHAEFDAPARITIRSHDGPFTSLHQVWSFEDAGLERTAVRLQVAYALRSGLLERVLGRLFEPVLSRTVEAFERRVGQIASRQEG